MKNEVFNRLPIWGWMAIAVVLLCQSTWLFLDARKRGANPWVWGLWGIIHAPWPTIIYLFVVRKIHHRKT